MKICYLAIEIGYYFCFLRGETRTTIYMNNVSHEADLKVWIVMLSFRELNAFKLYRKT